ncbi:MAG TPA: hypothetical protein VGU68_08795 [Ktedonobacteraceae bacterium]|nr:hypothetical protein [Ktedonobacteraceae bacterium]
MSEHGGIESRQQFPPFSEHVSAIFARLDAADVEQFYKSYHLWSLQQRIGILRIEAEALQQAIVENDRLQQQVRPSAIALASLAQFQASGVNDTDLLDRMLERGEDWLDHTIQLLRHCEELDMIGGNYTQWCENALEGAYEWIESMNESAAPPLAAPTPDAQPLDAQPSTEIATEEQLLQKLMSEEEQAEKLPVADQQNEESVAVAASTPVAILEDEPTDAINGEDDNAPKMEESSVLADTADAAPQALSSVPQVRLKTSQHFLRRVLASVWHDRN